MELFGTAGIRGPVADRLTPGLALAVGRAAAEDGETFVVGRDGRTSSEALARAVGAGLESGGARVLDAGVVPTPTLAFASRDRRGIMVTASHNPPTDNGLKLFVDGQEYDGDAEAAIERRVEESAGPTTWERWQGTTELAPLSAYRRAVTDYATNQAETAQSDHPTGGQRLAVAVDCGNGMAGLATPQVLRSLGVDVIALEANVDGHFPARASKPTPESLTALRKFVAETPATFGIAHDGDADRIVVVDGDGDVVHEDTVLAILAEHYVEDSDVADPTVVTTPNASGRIDERVAAAGGRIERVSLGALHEGIAAASGDVVFAAEPWKHVHPALGGWIDGIASAAVFTRLVERVGLDALREPVQERPYRKESVDCPDEAKAPAMAALESTLPDAFPDSSVSTEYGVRLSFSDGGWVLVRPSGTEPYVRVYAERESVETLVDEITDCVESAIADVAARAD